MASSLSQPTQLLPTSILAADALQRGQAAYDRQDYLIAFREWLPLAQQGIALAQYNLGVLYMKGQGVAPDDAQAVRRYRQAAAQGYALAQHNLGLMYVEGRGVAQDLAEASRLFAKAAEKLPPGRDREMAVQARAGRASPRHTAGDHPIHTCIRFSTSYPLSNALTGLSPLSHNVGLSQISVFCEEL